MSAFVTSLVSLEVRERLVDGAGTEDFAELICIAGLDSKKHLRFADWSGVDFSGSDLRGFDFTGAKLIGCNFEWALIEGARFDQALIDNARPGAKLYLNRTNLRVAEDWDAYVRTWVRAKKRDPEYLPPGAVFQDAPFAPEMVVVPPGQFMMGSKDDEGAENERPWHKVIIPRAFAVSRSAVTFNEWVDAHTAGGVKHKPDEWWRLGGQPPVIDVSWEDAQAYVKWLSNETGKLYRLLSEAEWEYACRAGTGTGYSFGDSISRRQAQFSEEGWGSAGATVQVGSFPANDFGLYDMHGNVCEWCEDRWHESYVRKPQSLKQTGDAWVTGDSIFRVLRGGSWLDDPYSLRSACRFKLNAENRTVNAGFRVARTLITS